MVDYSCVLGDTAGELVGREEERLAVYVQGGSMFGIPKERNLVVERPWGHTTEPSSLCGLQRHSNSLGRQWAVKRLSREL